MKFRTCPGFLQKSRPPNLSELSGVKQLLESIAKLEAELNPWEVEICRLECSQAALAASDAALAKGCVKMVGATQIA